MTDQECVQKALEFAALSSEADEQEQELRRVTNQLERTRIKLANLKCELTKLVGQNLQTRVIRVDAYSVVLVHYHSENISSVSLAKVTQ